jgi:diaminopimelate epimerase
MEPGMPADHSIRLTKYQALGNDYLVVDAPGGVPESLIRLVPSLCERHLGVGADGVLVFDHLDLGVRVFNPDGSEAEKSGNGLRIAACHAVLEHGRGREFELSTRDRSNRVRVLSVDGARVICEVEMGPARFDPAGWVTLETPAGAARCQLVSVGNPHCVVFDQPVTRERCEELGPLLERHPRFPNRTNVQLVEVLGPARARVEIWERGAGYTLASGTSASAVAAALIHLGRTGPSVEVEMPGGTLSVRREADGGLVQMGPAQRVFRADVDRPQE